MDLDALKTAAEAYAKERAEAKDVDWDEVQRVAEASKAIDADSVLRKRKAEAEEEEEKARRAADPKADVPEGWNVAFVRPCSASCCNACGIAVSAGRQWCMGPRFRPRNALGARSHAHAWYTARRIRRARRTTGTRRRTRCSGPSPTQRRRFSSGNRGGSCTFVWTQFARLLLQHAARFRGLARAATCCAPGFFELLCALHAHASGSLP